MTLLGSGRDPLTCVCSGQCKPLNLPVSTDRVVAQTLRMTWQLLAKAAVDFLKYDLQSWVCLSLRESRKWKRTLLCLSQVRQWVPGSSTLSPRPEAVTYSTAQCNSHQLIAMDSASCQHRDNTATCHVLSRNPAFLKFCKGHQRLKESSDLLTLFFNHCWC